MRYYVLQNNSPRAADRSLGAARSEDSRATQLKCWKEITANQNSISSKTIPQNEDEIKTFQITENRENLFPAGLDSQGGSSSG